MGCYAVENRNLSQLYLRHAAVIKIKITQYLSWNSKICQLKHFLCFVLLWIKCGLMRFPDHCNWLWWLFTMCPNFLGLELYFIGMSFCLSSFIRWWCWWWLGGQHWRGEPHTTALFTAAIPWGDNAAKVQGVLHFDEPTEVCPIHQPGACPTGSHR